MNKGFRKFLILLLVFIAAVFGFSILTNHEKKDLTEDMADATLPIVYLQENDQLVNELHGYVQEMDVSSMRDTITPLDEDGQLKIRIATYGNEISKAAFEVRSLDTTRLVQNGEIADFQVNEEKGIADSQISIENLLIEGTEYQLKITVNVGEKECYYYTRIIKEPDSYISECLEFVRDFHQITMDKARQRELTSYLESSSAGDNTNLNLTDIQSSLKQVCWSDFNCVEESEPVASVMEQNDEYNVITLDYMISSTTEDGVVEYYNVEEYYRVKYGTEKMYLLSFERSVNEIFRAESTEVDQKFLNLGIRSEEVDFASNQTGHIICFVQQGELWSFNIDENKLTQVFSFRDGTDMDLRENYNEHDIKIVRAKEGGDVDFIVYGYMNRGAHEGQVGISACHYDAMTNTVDEKLFIPGNTSFQMMKEQMGQIMYTSDKDMFYLTIGDQLHQINLDTMEDKVLIDNLLPGEYKGSDDGRYICWLDTVVSEAHVMHLMDLENETVYDVQVGAEQAIYPLGFSGSDCIYGVGNVADARVDGGGTYGLACSEVVIIDSVNADHKILKTYDGKGFYVTGITVDEGSIYLDRVQKNKKGAYVAAEQDTIRNRDLQDDPLVYISTLYDDVKQTEVTLQTSTKIRAGKPKLLVPDWIVAEGNEEISIGDVPNIYEYYVYAKGKIMLATNDMIAAIGSANDNRGVVINRDQNYVWKRGKKASRNPMEVNGAEGSSTQAKAVNAILTAAGAKADADGLMKSGSSAYQVLADTLGADRVYDLTGCTVDEILYYVGRGIPVYAMRADGQAVLVTGYDNNYTWVYDFTSNTSTPRLTSAAREQFAEAGNVFYVVN